MKVGVISDTHVPAIVPSLPPAVFDIFKGVDLILHAGDIVDLSVLDELRAIAPVEAVAGNMDDTRGASEASAQESAFSSAYSVSDSSTENSRSIFRRK